ncbi:MAG: OmpH family outer membrane protein [Myxococcales bacterium]
MRATRSLLLAMLILFPLSASAAELKLGYVDYQRILLESNDGKAAKARLQAWLDGRQKEADQEQDALRKEKEQLEKQAGVLSPDTQQKKGAELQQKIVTLAQKWERLRAESAEKERKEMEPILKKIETVVGTIAAREGMAMVFEKRESGVVFAQAQLDVTNEVLRTLNGGK